MKKLLCKTLALTLAISSFMSITPIYANNTNSNFALEESKGSQELRLIDQKEYYDNDGTFIVEKLYTDVNVNLKATSGSGTFKKTKEEKYDGIANNILSYYVSGDFTWDSQKNTVTVSNVSSGHDNLSGLTYSKESTEHGDNKGGVFPGKKYAYAKYSFTTTNKIGQTKNLSVYVDVNIEGKSSTK